MEFAVQARNLEKRYGDLVAVNGINFHIKKGEYFGMLGPNGAGKTTTVAMIYCFLPVDDGELCVLDKNVAHDARTIKSQLGVVPQENNLDGELTVLENLIIYASYFGIPKEISLPRALEQLEFFGLSAKKDVDVDALSGGMKRRLTIARAMMNDPAVLILDEPTTGLDPEARHYIWQHLKQLKKTGLTLLLTTHYLEEASQLCDRIAIMDEGKILEEGAPKALILEHIGKQVVEVTLPAEFHHNLIEKTKPSTNGHLTIGDTVYLHSQEEPGAILETLRSLLMVETIFVRPANLEDVFLKLTGRRFGGE